MAKKAPTKAPAKSTPDDTPAKAASAPKAAAPKAAEPKAKAPAPTAKAEAAPKKASGPPLAGYTVTFIHPGNRTLALPSARAACEADGATTTDRKIPRHLVNMSRLLKVYGPSMAEATAMVERLAPFFRLEPMQSKDSTEKAYYIFVD